MKVNNSTLDFSAAGAVRPGSRIASVEFLRIFFCLCVILYHVQSVCLPAYQSLFHSTKKLFSKGYFSVECFFVIGGFFLFLHIQKHKDDVVKFIKKLYIRLFPALLVIGLLALIFHIIHSRSLVDLFLLLSGLAFPKEIIGYGDWFVGVYFWATIFFYILLTNKKHDIWCWVLGLVYITVSLQFHGTRIGNVLEGTYFGWLGAGLCRGISGIGIGILAALVSQYIHFSSKQIVRVCLTIIESTVLFVLCRMLVRGGAYNFLQMDLLCALALCLMTPRGGYLSACLNRQQWVCALSRYTYSVFVMQMLSSRLVNDWKFEAGYSLCLALVLPIVLGVLEYHLVEKKLVPLTINYFSKTSK